MMIIVRMIQSNNIIIIMLKLIDYQYIFQKFIGGDTAKISVPLSYVLVFWCYQVYDK